MRRPANHRRFIGIVVAAGALTIQPLVASADLVVGNFENSLDGWADWTFGGVSSTFSYDTFGATLGTTSLKVVPNQSYSQHLSIKLQDRNLVGAFLLSGKLAIDVSWKKSDYTGGGTYSVISTALNSSGTGFTDIGRPTSDTGNPGYFGGWDPTNFADNTRTVTWDMTRFIDGDTSNGEITAVPSANNGGYLEFIMSTAYDPSFDPTTASIYFDNARFIDNVVSSQWKNSLNNGQWYSSLNWGGGVPGVAGATANFGTNGGALTTPQSVNVDSSVTLGALNFDNAAGYTLSGTGGITMDSRTAGTPASLSVASGSHTIASAISLNSDLNLEVTPAASTLTLGAPLAGNGHALTISGAGKTIVPSLQAGVLTVNGGTLQLTAAGSKVTGVAVAGAGSKLDLAGAATLAVDYAASSPLADINAALAGGRITTSAAVVNSNYAVGFAEASALQTVPSIFGSVDGSTVLLRVTRKGDGNLDGTVNFSDLLTLAQNYGGSGKSWVNGDANYDNLVNFGDLLALAQNYGQAAVSADALIAAGGTGFAADWALAQSLVPEPTSIAALGMVAASIVRRRR